MYEIKKPKGWSKEKERKFWDKNVFFLVKSRTELQQIINIILTLTNDETM